MRLILLTIAGLLISIPTLHAAPLHDAAETGNSARIKHLIQEGHDIREVDSRGIWPLLAATSYGHSEAVKTLLSLGADPNQADKYAYAAIHEAASLGYYDVVKILINAKAKLNTRDINGITPLGYAMRSPSRDAVELLKSVGAVQ